MTGAPAVRIARLKIEKFRAIRSADIELGDTVALVGQNGAGKSSVLRALNAFFNFEDEREDFERGRHAYTKASQAVIEVAIDGMPDDTRLPTVLHGDGRLRARLKFKKSPVWECWHEGRWQPAHHGLHDALRKHISYALIPTRRDHEVAHPSRGLLERAVGEWVTKGRQRDRTSPKVAQLGESLQKNSLSGLERQLRKIAPSEGPFSFEPWYATPPDYKLLLANLALTVLEGGQSIPLSESGSGTQSVAIIAIYAYLAELQSRTLLLGLEEPEQNLHPQAQNQLMRNLGQLGLQVILTTHSPSVVDSLDHEQVVLCRRVNGKARGLEVRLTQISTDFFERHKLNREKCYKFHRRRNSEFMFDDFVVVTESPIDAAVISALLDEGRQEVDARGITLISLDGVELISYMYHLLRELEIDCAFVVDKDYFLPYKVNNERSKSLDSRGYPKYASVLKNGTLVESIFPDRAEREILVRQLQENHSEAMATLRTAQFFCFRYSLEVDLIAASEPRTRIFDHFGIPPGDRTERKLLVDMYKAIKKQDVLLMAVSGLSPKALPNSYKSLRRELPKMVSRTQL